jgi:WD40 repeat protein
LAGSGDNTVRIFDLKQKKMSATLNDHSSEVLSVSINNDDSYIASSGMNGQIYVNQMSDLKSKYMFSLNDFKTRCVLFSQMREQQLGSCHDDGTVAVWDIAANKLFHKFDSRHTEACTSITFSPVNHMLMGSVSLDK